MAKRPAPVEMGTANASGVDYDWIPKELLQQNSKCFLVHFYLVGKEVSFWYACTNSATFFFQTSLQKPVLLENHRKRALLDKGQHVVERVNERTIETMQKGINSGRRQFFSYLDYY